MKNIIDKAMQLSFQKFSNSYKKALDREIPEKKYLDFESLWLSNTNNDWDFLPDKIRKLSSYGDLDLGIQGDRYLKISVYSKEDFSDLSEVLCFFRYRGIIMYTSDYSYLFTKQISTQDTLNRIFRDWKLFLKNQKIIEENGEIYSDISDILQNSSCRLNCHWKWDGILLDRYLGKEIDFQYFLVNHFYTKEKSESFEKFVEKINFMGMNREKIWTLFSPSGERIWKIVAVLRIDEYMDWFLIESKEEFLEIFAYGRK